VSWVTAMNLKCVSWFTSQNGVTELAIRGELDVLHGLLEVEMMEHDSSTAIHEQGSTIFAA
jgi:hypothetical protein